MWMRTWIVIVAVVGAVAAPPVSAAENELTPEEKAAGWQLLFNGKDYDDWFVVKGGKRAAPNMTIDQGCLVPLKCGGYNIYHKKQFGDFILKCDIKFGTKRVNSGIFFRVGNPANPVQTGLEMQVSSGRGTGSHAYGAIYDAAKAKKPVPVSKDGWDHVVLTAKGPKITVEINGELITEMNCDDYTEARKNPDGSRNKYRKPIKDFPRKGYIGFQDHHDGTKAMYRNIRILDLEKATR